MDGQQLLQQLQTAKTGRVSVYLNEKRIYELFRTNVTRINSIVTSGELGAGFSAGFSKILGVELSGKKGISSTFEIPPSDKALLLELFENKRGKLFSVDHDHIPTGALLSYFGLGRIANDGEDVTTQTSFLSDDVAKLIQARRITQAKGSKEGTIVWSARNRKLLASIAYMESVVDIGHIYSYPEGISVYLVAKRRKKVMFF